jgi:hypothetical protein
MASGYSKIKNRVFLYHFHSSRVPQSVLKFTHTWVLGGSTLVLAFMQVIAGVLLFICLFSDAGGGISFRRSVTAGCFQQPVANDVTAAVPRWE